jgi:hypothetical protein
MREHRHDWESPGVMKLILQWVGDSHLFMTFLPTYKPREIERLRQQRQELFACHPLVQHDMPLGVDAMELKHLFGCVNPECGNLCHRGPSCERGDDACYPHHDRHPRGCTAGWVHTINSVSPHTLLLSTYSTRRPPGCLKPGVLRWGLPLRHGVVQRTPSRYGRAATVSWLPADIAVNAPWPTGVQQV